MLLVLDHFNPLEAIMAGIAVVLETTATTIVQVAEAMEMPVEVTVEEK